MSWAVNGCNYDELDIKERELIFREVKWASPYPFPVHSLSEDS